MRMHALPWSGTRLGSRLDGRDALFKDEALFHTPRRCAGQAARVAGLHWRVPTARAARCMLCPDAVHNWSAATELIPVINC